MSRVRFEFDHDGIAEWLLTEPRGITDEAAAAVREKAQERLDQRPKQYARDPGLDASLEHYTTDRPHDVVSIVGGAAHEAKHGTLVAAATEVGLDVGPNKMKGGRTA